MVWLDSAVVVIPFTPSMAGYGVSFVDDGCLSDMVSYYYCHFVQGTLEYELDHCGICSASQLVLLEHMQPHVLVVDASF